MGRVAQCNWFDFCNIVVWVGNHGDFGWRYAANAGACGAL